LLILRFPPPVISALFEKLLLAVISPLLAKLPLIVILFWVIVPVFSPPPIVMLPLPSNVPLLVIVSVTTFPALVNVLSALLVIAEAITELLLVNVPLFVISALF